MNEWTKLLARSLAYRLEPDKFEKFAQLLSAKYPLAPRRIADILLRPTKFNTESPDPRILYYLERLLHADLVDLPSILRALLRYSNVRPTGELKVEDDDHKHVVHWSNASVRAETILYTLAKSMSNGLRPKNSQEAIEMILILTEWAKALAAASDADDMMHEAQVSEAINVRVALGTLLVAASDNRKILSVLGTSFPKERGRAFSSSLAGFTPLLIHSSSLIAERLELFRSETLLPLEPVDKKTQAANDEINQMIDSSLALGMDSVSVVDLPSINSRAGLYIYLQALLVGRPLIDDDNLFNYLNNRYQGDVQTTFIDLILTSFDVLANAMFRNEGERFTVLLRSFLINKVPLLLNTLSHSMFQPLTPEYCITEALNHVDTNTFPTLSSMLDDDPNSENIFADSVRQDFCFACCLHNLISEDSIEGLLGEPPIQALPASGRYTKVDLVHQCLTDPERTESLLEELERMDGNVGAVSQAIVEMIRQYCESKETMSLKTICSHLARHPSSLDVMLLFDKPSTILQPICELLDNWRYEEDQGEYQPVYEEFGSIILLVLAFVHRYDLSVLDLGLQNRNSFIRKLLVRGALSRPMDELSEQEMDQMDGWIKGLFNPAVEGSLGDEPMSKCPPQDFYLLIPTLFQQIVLACTMGHLSEETLKGGLEYLVDTFLLPSLVGALTWLANHLWESHGDSNIIIQILQTLINPSSSASDPDSMLSSILNITARPLENSLRWLQHSEPQRQDIEPLSKTLKPHLALSRTTASDYTELESWTNSYNGSITNSIRHTIQSLIQWSLAAGINIMPTSYTHRQILNGMQLVGAKCVLNAMIEEVKAQTETGSGAIAIDVAAAIISAPIAESSILTLQSAQLVQILGDTSSTPQTLQNRLSLHEVLRIEAENAPKSDVAHLETVIRLFRKVEALLTIALPQADILPHDLDGLGVVSGGMEVGTGVDLDGTIMNNGQAINDALAATAADQEMMDVFAREALMGVGDDDLLGDLKLEF